MLLFAVDTAPVADWKEKSYRLVSEFGVNVGKITVMTCLRYGNEGCMYVRLNGTLLEEVDCLKGIQVQDFFYYRSHNKTY